jgi:hypothetical protein
MRPLSVLVAGVAVLLVACGAKPDPAKAAIKSDQSPIAGADLAYAAPGWKVGDATGWEQHMRARTQNQNEYSRTQQAPR